MPRRISDEIAIVLFREVIIPWETKLSTLSGCWDIKRTREYMKPHDFHLECVSADQISNRAEALRDSKSKNFVIWFARNSQAKDLFRYLRNCAAHATFETIESGRKSQVLRFRATGRDKTTLLMEGDIQPRNLVYLVRSLASH